MAEERVDVLLEEISQFEGDVTDLEKEMHALAKAERENAAVLKGNLKHKLRDQKIRLDKEFGVMLAKIADRKRELKDLQKKLQDLGITRQGKNEEMKTLERKLVVLLEAQEQQIEAIRRKRENRREDKSTVDGRNTQRVCCDGVDARETGGGSSSSSALSPYQDPTVQQRQEAADLMSSTEQMMKFGFMSMSMTYFSSLNMVRAMKKAAVLDPMLVPAPSSAEGMPKSPGEMMGMSASPGGVLTSPPNATTANQVRNWTVNDVAKWLSTQRLDIYADSFREGAVDGNFLCKLTDDDLRGTLGVEHKLHRKKILCGIEELIAPLVPTSPLVTYHPSTVAASASADATSTAVPSSPQVSPSTPAKVSTPTDAMLSSDTTSTLPQGGLVPPTFEELATWVRNKKFDKLHEAIEILPTKPFDERDVRVQFAEDVGTAYVQSYDNQVYHLNKRDGHGNTLLHVAAQNGATRIAKMLIAKGANPNHQNKEGQTPGHFAIAYQFLDFASWLFDDSNNGGKANDGLTNIYGLGVYDGLGREEGEAGGGLGGGKKMK